MLKIEWNGKTNNLINGIIETKFRLNILHFLCGSDIKIPSINL